MKVVHLLQLPNTARILSKLLPEVKFVPFDSIDEISRTSEVEILVGSPDVAGPVFSRSPNLKWYQCTYAGIDAFAKYCRETQLNPSAVITRFGGVLAPKIAEWTIAQMIARERNFIRQMDDQRSCLWNQDNYLLQRNLYDLTIGIIGVGDIGRRIAESCKHFKMTVLGIGRRELDEFAVPECLDMYRSFRNMEEVLEKCDYICSVLPHTPQTIGFYDGEILRACATKSPVFINIGRGSAISTARLLYALETGWISHAILDVFEDEPLPANSPLWLHPQVTLSPHVSGCYNPSEVAMIFVENFKRYVNGEELKYIVDINIGY